VAAGVRSGRQGGVQPRTRRAPPPLRRPGFTGTTRERPPVQVPPRRRLMSRFACPTCKAVLTAPDDRAGTKGLRPTCGQTVQVPTPPPPARDKTVLGKLLPEDFAALKKAAVSATPFAAEDPIPAFRSAPVPPPMPEIPCPHCRRAVANDPRFAGQVVRCPHCGEAFFLSGPQPVASTQLRCPRSPPRPPPAVPAPAN